MKFPRLMRFAVPALLLTGALACKGSNDVTSSSGALARLQLDAPTSAVSGQAFNVNASALNVGVSGIHNGVVQVTLPAPLAVSSVTPSAGTTAVFSNAGGGSVTWNLNTLDSNTQSTLRIGTIGTLPPGGPAQTVTIHASMTADGINPGDATASRDVQIMP